MTPEEKSLLLRTHELAEENNAILRSIRRANRWSTFFRIVYWVIIIGAGIGAYYALQPYLMQAADIIHQGQSVLNNLPK
ncbi:MAG: hypothetical protein KGI45_01860 [Patescibacteria group bacterium]|nr:hypothetical protein [Patescibacteria group bacterium]MDE1940661.1 hypothetical protein [Patescibacteria group bacterium]MDE1966799.1 hypothetical protein [Patescibacteria group bacterium]